jgi:hypothetical protein
MKFRYILVFSICFSFIYAAIGLQDKRILLRFTPEVGNTYTYYYSTNLNKTTFGKTQNEKVEGRLSYSILKKDKDGFQARLDMELLSSNISKPAFNKMKAETAKPRFYNISDRFVFDKEGVYNLCFPDEKTTAGGAWEGECCFNIGDMSSVKVPAVKVSYRLVNLDNNAKRNLCTIEGRQLDRIVKVPIQMGMLGIKCDPKGKVIAVEPNSGAYGKIKTGDIVIAFEGQKAETPQERHQLYERYIESVNNIGENVKITVMRNGSEKNFEITKSSTTIGNMAINIERSLRTVKFDADKGIILSDLISAKYVLTYDIPPELPFVDDYSGAEPLKRLTKSKLPERIYDYEWKLVLEQ